jgi:D-3-phosphoglycerate dehydrogenase
MGLLFSRFKIDKPFLDKASNLQFIARVGAGLKVSIATMRHQKKSRSLLLQEIEMLAEHTLEMILSLII